MDHAPTLLAVLTAARHWTKHEAVTEFDRIAREISANATVSPRQWERWCAGDITSQPRPSSCRVLEAMFQRPVAALFAPPTLAVQLGELPTSHGTAAYDAYWEKRPTQDTPPGVLEEITAVADDSARFARRVRRLDETTIEQLDADVERLAEDYLRRPLIHTFRRVAELRADVFAMLDERHPLNQERALYLVAGKLCALLAHASADLGHPGEADTHARTALVCAELIDDNPLRAYTRWVQSLIAYWRGDYPTAAAIAKRARDHATSGTTLLRLTSQEARALAAAGLHDDFTQAAALAQTARDTAATAPVTEPGVFHFSPGKAAYYSAEAHTAIGEPDHLATAVAEATEAIDLLTTEPMPSAELVAAARLDLAAAHIAAGNIDGAADPLRQVLAIPPQHRTVPIVGRVHAAAHLLTTTDAPISAELTAEAETFTAYPAAPPALPSAP